MVIRAPAALTPAQQTGADAERQAAGLLQADGLKLIARNVRNRFGELDLIALERQTLVVIEVRARASARFGGAAVTVDRRKQARIIRATQAWLATQPAHRSRAIRFDVMAVDAGRPPQWIRGAFLAEGS